MVGAKRRLGGLISADAPSTTGGPISGDEEIFVAGFGSGGNHLFSFVLGQGFVADLSAGGGQVVLTGYTYGSLDFGGGLVGGAGGADLFIGSLTTSGVHT